MSSRPVLRSSVAVVTLAVAAALAGVTATSAQAAAPATAPVAAPSAAGARSIPAPRAFHDAVRGTARQAGRAGSTSVAPAGVHPIGRGVSTDLPTRVEVGAPQVTVPYTVVVPTGSLPQPTIDVALVVGNGDLVVEAATVGVAGQTRFTGAVTFPQSALTDLGDASWVVLYGDKKGNSVQGAALATTVKLRSLLSARVSRSGNQVSVFGATRVWAGAGYQPRVGTRVSVQRWNGQGWVTIASRSTDSRGHISATLRIPFRVGIRLTVRDTGIVFGASTAQAVV